MDSIAAAVKQTWLAVPATLRSKILLVGSANLYLQGVAVTPKKDLDFATDFVTVRELAGLWSDRLNSSCLGLSGDQKLPFPYLFITIDGHEVEFFDVQNATTSHYHGHCTPENTVELDAAGQMVRALNLPSELECYRRSGKQDKIRALEQHLASTDIR